MRHYHYILVAVAALFGYGCATPQEQLLSISLDVWDCRGEQPKRLTENDQLAPNFTDMTFPKYADIENSPR